MENLISINQAAELGICRLRMPIWAYPDDYLKIYIHGKFSGPWGEFYSKINALLNEENPIKFPMFVGGWNELKFEPYIGEISQDEKA